MPAIKYENYSMPETAKSKLPRAMIDDTFAGLGLWFSKMINPIEAEYQHGMTDQHDRTKTMIRLGKLAGKVSTMKDILEEFVNGEIKPKQPIVIRDFNLPTDATTLEDSKKLPEKRLPAPKMVAALFQALTPWFERIPPQIKPHYKDSVKDSDDRSVTRINLGGFIGQVNVIKNALLAYVNGQIELREKGMSFSAGDGVEVGEGGIQEVDIPADLGVEVIVDVLDVPIGKNVLPKIDDSGNIVTDGTPAVPADENAG